MEAELKALQEARDAVLASNDKLVGLIEKQGAEIKAQGASTEQTAARIAEFEKTWDQAKADVKGLTERIEDAEKKAARRNLGYSEPGGERAKSLGQLFAELTAMDEHKGLFQSAMARRSFKGTPQAEAKSVWTPENMGQKTLMTNVTTNFIAPYFVPDIVPMAEREPRIRGLMKVLQTEANSITYVRKTGFSKADADAATISGITRSSQTATATTSTAHGFRVGDRVLVSGADQAAYNIAAYILSVPSATTFTYTVAGTPTTPATTSTAFKVVRLNNYGAAAFVAEGAAKPQAQLHYDELTRNVQVIAHWIPASRQVLADRPGLQNSIDNDLLKGLRIAEDSALLYGNNSGQIEGIVNVDGVQTYNWSSGTFGDTMIDAIRRAYTLVQIAEESTPDGIVLHPNDMEKIELTKASTQQYILITSPGSTPGSAVVWRLPVVVTAAIVETTAVMGPWGSAGIIYDREQANVRFSDQHSDYFTSNLVAILGEERLAAAWPHPHSFVNLSFDGAPANPDA